MTASTTTVRSPESRSTAPHAPGIPTTGSPTADRSPVSDGPPAVPPTATTTELRARFAPVFEQIAAGALERERTRTLPHAEIRALAEAGFGRLRLPHDVGGFGASIPQLAALLVDLATADSNCAQIWRGHIAFVEDLLVTPHTGFRDRWLPRITAGAVIGNAWTEIGDVERGTLRTRIRTRDEVAEVTGEKFYSTGSIYADYADTTVADDAGVRHVALIPLDQPGVEVSDDWDGFGQRLTGTGTTRFTAARLDPRDVIPFSDRFRYQSALYQLVLLATQAGIATAVARDAACAVAARERSYSHGNADRVRDDPQILQIIGEAEAAAFTARAVVASAAEAVQRAHDTALPGVPKTASETDTEQSSDADTAANHAATLAVSQAQVALTRLVPEAAGRVFDALGSSAVREAAGLDRHWRNARTVGSHNPWVYKARLVGDHTVNGTAPEYQFAIGTVSTEAGDSATASAGT